MPRKFRGWSQASLEKRLSELKRSQWEVWPAAYILDQATANNHTYYRMRHRTPEGKPGELIRTISKEQHNKLRELCKRGREIYQIQQALDKKQEASNDSSESISKVSDCNRNTHGQQNDGLQKVTQAKLSAVDL